MNSGPSQMFHIDLHTHSTASPDGSLDEAAYREMVSGGQLDYVAITDHDTIEMAQKLHDEVGERIIIGQEITTTEGEIIGLYLTKKVSPHKTAATTVHEIKKQGGLVYIPHPFETVRKGITLETLNEVAKDVDIIETYNGRAAFQNMGEQAAAWARLHDVAAAASSDAHGRKGWGRTYSIISDVPTKDRLVILLKHAAFKKETVGWFGLLYPKLNRLLRRGKRA
jgi:predicted metal-dependent phosphoesterase TrpH